MARDFETLPAACRLWLSQVEALLEQGYRLSIEDAGWSREDALRYWGFGDEPRQFIDWFAEKYDLLVFE